MNRSKKTQPPAGHDISTGDSEPDGHGACDFQALVEAVGDALLVVNHEEHIVYGNHKALEILGYSREVLTTLRAREVIDPREVRQADENFGRRIAGKGAPATYESTLRASDGALVPVEVTASRVQWRGQPAVMGVFRNITGRKAMEKTLLDEKERLLVTLRSIGEAVFSLDTAGRIVLINGAAEALIGMDLAAAAGRDFSEAAPLKREDSDELITDPLELVLRDGRMVAQGRRAYVTCPDGSRRYVQDTSTPIVNPDGSVTGMVVVLKDVTQQRREQLEQQNLQKMDAIAALSDGLAHDFNNLLTTIIGNIGISKLHCGDSPLVQERLEEAEKAADKARDLTRQLSVMARKGEKRRKIATEPLLKEIMNLALGGTSLVGKLDLASSLWPIEVDVGQVSQALTSLVLNAVEASPQAGVVTLRAGNATVEDDQGLPLAPGPYVVIQVIDQGPGLGQGPVSRLFDAYHSTKEGHRGLGLTTALSVIQRHGGNISGADNPDRGATFTIHLPASGLESRRAAPGHVLNRAARPLRVLIMDDDRSIREVLRYMLEHLGFEVAETMEGRETISRYREMMKQDQKPDVVIMDLTIRGGMGGAEAVKRLKKLDPGAKVIVSSGYYDNPVMADYERHGFDGVVPKPYRLGDLYDILMDIIAP